MTDQSASPVFVAERQRGASRNVVGVMRRDPLVAGALYAGVAARGHAALTPSLRRQYAVGRDVIEEDPAVSRRSQVRKGAFGLEKESSVSGRSLRSREGVIGFGKAPRSREGVIGFGKAPRSREGVIGFGKAPSVSRGHRFRKGAFGLEKESSVSERRLRSREGVVGFGKAPSVSRRSHRFREGAFGLEVESRFSTTRLRSRRSLLAQSDASHSIQRLLLRSDASSFNPTPPRSIRRLLVRSGASSFDPTPPHSIRRLLVRSHGASSFDPTPSKASQAPARRSDTGSRSNSLHRGSARSMRLMRTARVRMPCATASSTTPSVAARSTAPTTSCNESLAISKCRRLTPALSLRSPWHRPSPTCTGHRRVFRTVPVLP